MSNRFKPYLEYQLTGLDWLGRVPKSWDLRRLGSYFRERREHVSDTDYPALSVTMQGIVPQLENAAKTKDGDNRKLVRKGDFAINSRSDRKGSSGVSPFDGSVSLITIVLEPVGLCPAYVHHLLRSDAFQEEFYRFGKGIVADLWSTNFEAMKNITIPVMSIDEQKQIAAFLDYETAKIDALIEKQQQLIALLGEKRQAVISHAVTKGLNPNAPMRDSGIEWLGDVPEHWVPSKVGALCSVVSKGTTPVNGFSDELDIPFVRVNNLTFTGELSLQDLVFVTRKTHQTEIGRSKIYPGDVLMNLVGPPLGKVGLVGEDYDEYNINQAVGFFRVSGVEASFLSVWLQTSFARDWFLLRAKKTSGQANLTLEHCRNLPIAVPDRKEQLAIVAELNVRLSKVDQILKMSHEQVSLLSERRTALISAAVTGKIDVRGWKRPNSDARFETEMDLA